METVKKRPRPYTSEEVVEILKKHGTNVTAEKAKLILESLRNLAKLTIDQYFNL